MLKSWTDRGAVVAALVTGGVLSLGWRGMQSQPPPKSREQMLAEMTPERRAEVLHLEETFRSVRGAR